jgi:predicted TIM-barrel fold metal-dependent hydrolase
MLDIVREIIDVRPDCVIWGSNWPHAGISVPMPNDGDLLDFLLAAAPEEHIRRLILADKSGETLWLVDHVTSRAQPCSSDGLSYLKS